MVATRIVFSEEALLDALVGFACDHLVEGGSLRLMGYAREKRVPSSSAILTRLGCSTWSDVLFVHRHRILAAATDLNVTVEVPYPCRKLGHTWQPMRARAWADVVCGCEYCQAPTIAEAYPELVARLVHPEDAVKTSLHWVLWGCPEGFITHMTISGRAAEVAVGTRYCGNCRSLDRWYATHTAGMLLTRSKVARAKVESAFVARLRELLPGERVAAQQAIVVPRAFAARVGKSVTPDVILFRRRIAIELDGGDGQSDRYSRHDTLAGAEGDTARDQALASIGWTTIRVRHPDALALPGSPAVIVSTRAATGGSGLKIAQVVAEQVKALLVLR